jgi:hypothetical protein
MEHTRIQATSNRRIEAVPFTGRTPVLDWSRPSVLSGRSRFAVEPSQHKSYEAARIRRRPTSTQEFRAFREYCYASPEANAQNWQISKADYFAQIQKLRQELEGNLLRFPRPCRFVMWRVTLARQIAVGQAMAEHLRHNGREALGIRQLADAIFAMVVTEHLFINVAREMKRLYGNIGSLERSLEQTPEVLHAVRVNAAMHIGLSFVHNVVNESALQSIVVGNSVIGIDCAAEFHILEYFVLQRFARHVRHNCSTHPTQIAVEDSLHNGFVFVRAAAFHFQATALVHVLRDSADEGFIRFHFATFAADLRTAEPFALHHFANSLQYKPCGRLRHAKSAAKFMRTDSILRVSQKPKRRHPLIKANRGIFHDRLDLNRELALAGIAEPQFAGLDKRVLRGRATRTHNVAIRPAQFLGKLKATVGVAKVNDGFLQRFGSGVCLVAIRKRYHKLTCVSTSLLPAVTH